MLSSIDKLIRDRASSPLFSTLTITWLIWNWKIVYLTLFINSSQITPSNKIDFILSNYAGWWYNLAFPVVSTVFLLLVVPYAENWIYGRYLYFKTARRTMKDDSESKARLSIEESNRIREENSNLIEEHRKELSRKEDVIKSLNGTLQEYEVQKRKLRIFYAGYGKLPADGFKEVTNDLNSELEKSTNNSLRFSVENNAFTVGDPAPNKTKDFLIVFEANGVVRQVTAKEHDTFDLSQTESIHSVFQGSSRKL
jgi:hypothetical protein